MAVLDPLAWLLTKMLPARQQGNDTSGPRYPTKALSIRPRLRWWTPPETLRMGDFVEAMLRQVMQALMTGNRASSAKSRAWTIRLIASMKYRFMY
jgi:phosphate:Na+ symporter